MLKRAVILKFQARGDNYGLSLAPSPSILLQHNISSPVLQQDLQKKPVKIKLVF
jgi:hypothetical protein